MTSFVSSTAAVRWRHDDDVAPVAAVHPARRWAFRGVLALFVVLILASYAVPLWFELHGDKLLVVTSGSMAPEIQAGDAVVVRQVTSASQLRVGQVVTFYPLGSGQLVTHRIFALVAVDALDENGRRILDPNGNAVTEPFIKTKGDANQSPDADTTPVTAVRGIVREIHTGWGYPLGYAHSPVGRLLLFGIPLLMLASAELASRLPGDARARLMPWRRTSRRDDDQDDATTTMEHDDAPALV